MTMAGPFYDKYSFLFKEILGDSPENALRYCLAMLNKWTSDWSKKDDTEIANRMRNFEKKKCMLLVWLSDKFGEKADDSVEERKTYRLMSVKYDDLLSMDIVGIIDNGDIDQALRSLLPSVVTTGDCNAEKDRLSERQLQQHLIALLYLRQAARLKAPLSESLIRNAHKILMWKLHNDEDEEINAGQYRKCSVRTGNHVYPDWECVPGVMQRIVHSFNTKVDQGDHDAFQVASWLLYEVLEIHPFLDGNGRLSRLLWCFSLIKDGLPFPVIPFPEKSKAYEIYIKCIRKDQDIASSRSDPLCSNLASLTLISVTRTWQNFILNLRSESRESHRQVIEWLKEENIVQQTTCTVTTIMEH